MFRLRAHDTVRFLFYLNVIVMVEEGGLSLQKEGTEKRCSWREEEGEEEEERRDGISASLCSLWLR